MKSNHTPGPWKTIGRYVSADTKGIKQLQIAEVNYFVGDEQKKENLKLIASAPDLFMSCRHAIEFIDKLSAQKMLNDGLFEESEELYSELKKAMPDNCRNGLMF